MEGQLLCSDSLMVSHVFSASLAFQARRWERTFLDRWWCCLWAVIHIQSQSRTTFVPYALALTFPLEMVLWTRSQNISVLFPLWLYKMHFCKVIMDKVSQTSPHISVRVRPASAAEDRSPRTTSCVKDGNEFIVRNLNFSEYLEPETLYQFSSKNLSLSKIEFNRKQECFPLYML